ncbi:hypothetical protein EZV62_019042 [Acer yangbiense]|uniref:DNA-directed RNA polymerase RpoA/D/Rpb3-type domain-containing protein n=1 Tax=Acer yangbiense TaxID=1000413 RepID=A0A5C7HC92_9ROSI|nr:hypothetical protein EZV62_019042 [Acer yangbiense]
MAKSIPRSGSCRTGRMGSRKSAPQILKGVIHVQASFNNTIVTVTYVQGRVISWSSANTCGFRGTRRGIPFAAQTVARNAIRAITDQGQADTIGIAMGRALLGEIEGICITRAKFEKIPHEYSTIVGPGYVTAQDILLPPFVEIVDNTQHIANLTEPTDFCIGLQIERNRGYIIKTPNNFQDGSYPIDAIFMHVRNANHSIHSYGNGNEKQEILFLEIWTNGGLTPKEALHEASRNLIYLFIPFLQLVEENLHLENNQYKVSLPYLTFHDRVAKLKKNKIAWKSIFIDQSKLFPRISNCLKKSNVHTLFDLLNHSQEDRMKIEHFRIEDVKRILGILEKK